MELAPAVKHGTSSLGCIIKGWRNTPKVKEITIGSKIISIDGEYVESMTFAETVERIRQSKGRVVLLESPAKTRRSPRKENASPNVTMNRDNEGNIDSYEIIPIKSTLSTPLAKTGSRPSTSVGDSPNTVIHKLRQEHKQKDGKLLMLQGQHRTTTQQLLLSQEEAKKLEVELVNQQSELASARDEVLHVKGEKRDCDGQILLLKYQLDRIKRQHAERASSQVSAKDQLASEVREREAWLAHWTKFRSTLQSLSRQGAPTRQTPCRPTPAPLAVCVDAGQQCEASSTSEVQYELLVQQRLSHRLEMQLRCWVDGQITLHKQLAAEEGLMDFKKAQSMEADARNRSRYTEDEGRVVMQMSFNDSRAQSEFVRHDSPCSHHDIRSQYIPHLTAHAHSAHSTGIVSREENCDISHISRRDAWSQSSRAGVQPSAMPTPSSAWCSDSNSDGNRYQDRHRTSPQDVERSRAGSGNLLAQSSAPSPVLSPQVYRSMVRSAAPNAHHQPVQHDYSMMWSDRKQRREYGSNYTADKSRNIPNAPAQRQIPHSDEGHVATASSCAPLTRPPPAAASSAAAAGTSTSHVTGGRGLKSVALREQMRRLREESENIRGDLVKFRSTIREVRDECGGSSVSSSRIFR
jgi:hypothetical protein